MYLVNFRLQRNTNVPTFKSKLVSFIIIHIIYITFSFNYLLTYLLTPVQTYLLTYKPFSFNYSVPDTQQASGSTDGHQTLSQHERYLIFTNFCLPLLTLLLLINICFNLLLITHTFQLIYHCRNTGRH